jgi:hypothetical protein
MKTVTRALSLTLMLMTLVSTSTVSLASNSTPLTPATPTNVTAKPGVAAVTVSWRSSRKASETFTVTSTPLGKGCVVVDLTSCTIPVTDSTPWQFQVTASSGSLSSPPSGLTPVIHHRTLLILAGQSNATGAQSYAIDPTTNINYLAAPYTNDADVYSTVSWMPWLVGPVKGHKKTGQVGLDTAQFEADANGNPVQIFGPEIGWARQVYADTGQPVSIIKAAFPNTSLAAYWSPSIQNGIFSQMVTKVTTTMAADAKSGQLDTIGAIAWYQGESDASDPTMAAAYQTNLNAFIVALRSQLPADPTAPIVLVKESLASLIASWQAFGMCGTSVDCVATATGDTEVRASDDWAAANLPGVVEVDSLGLPRFENLIHLSNTSELTIGQEIATASDHLMP